MRRDAMQWRGWGDRPREYTGDLRYLGWGVPRPRAERGTWRRIVWDLAFGYVSGFPKRDIVWYVWKVSIRRPPARPLAAIVTEIDAADVDPADVLDFDDLPVGDDGIRILGLPAMRDVGGRHRA